MPLIVLVGWSGAFNKNILDSTDMVVSTFELYALSVGFLWKPMELYMKCDNPLFCSLPSEKSKIFLHHLEEVNWFQT